MTTIQAERDNYKQKTEALIKSHHELSRMIDKLWAEVQGLQEMFRKVQEALNPEPQPHAELRAIQADLLQVAKEADNG